MIIIIWAISACFLEQEIFCFNHTESCPIHPNPFFQKTKFRVNRINGWDRTRLSIPMNINIVPLVVKAGNKSFQQRDIVMGQ